MRNDLFVSLSPDLDECADGTDRCDQECNNTNGSYTCGCISGYFLYSVDNFTCEGKTEDTKLNS